MVGVTDIHPTNAERCIFHGYAFCRQVFYILKSKLRPKTPFFQILEKHFYISSNLAIPIHKRGAQTNKCNSSCIQSWCKSQDDCHAALYFRLVENWYLKVTKKSMLYTRENRNNVCTQSPLCIYQILIFNSALFIRVNQVHTASWFNDEHPNHI